MSIVILIGVKVYKNVRAFTDELAKQEPNRHGFFDMQLVKIIHTPDAEYNSQVERGEDKLGFQPLLLKFANPFTQETEQVVIQNVTDELAGELRQFYKKQYLQVLPKKFGSFMPDTFDAFTEYDSWEAFESTWLTRNGESVAHINMPLLFDHISDLEYWTKKQTKEKVLNYQRMLVVTYFVPENKFFKFFIKNVDDAERDRIQRIVQGRLGLEEKMFAV